MFNPKRFLLLGSIGMLFLSSLLFTFNYRVPIAHAAYSESCPPSQSYGNQNTWVQVIQFDLDAWGGVPHVVTPNGDFNQDTKDDVHWYQNTVMGITDGGDVVGDRTWSSMGFCTGFSPIQYKTQGAFGFANCPATLANGNAGTWVKALQQALNVDAAIPSDPFYVPISKSYQGVTWWPLTIDGVFGTNTEDAVKSLQNTNGLTQDGIVGTHTWGVMWMCH